MEMICTQNGWSYISMLQRILPSIEWIGFLIGLFGMRRENGSQLCMERGNRPFPANP